MAHKVKGQDEILESHIRFHVVNPDSDPRSEQARGAQDLIEALITQSEIEERLMGSQV